MKTAILILALLTSCTSIKQAYQGKRIRMDSVYQTMSPQELAEHRKHKTVAKIIVIGAIIVVGTQTAPLVAYSKQP
jgi:hypothetical protein